MTGGLTDKHSLCEKFWNMRIATDFMVELQNNELIKNLTSFLNNGEYEEKREHSAFHLFL